MAIIKFESINSIISVEPNNHGTMDIIIDTDKEFQLAKTAIDSLSIYTEQYAIAEYALDNVPYGKQYTIAQYAIALLSKIDKEDLYNQLKEEFEDE